jgi:parallel beta-helix repeat protein
LRVGGAGLLAGLTLLGASAGLASAAPVGQQRAVARGGQLSSRGTASDIPASPVKESAAELVRCGVERRTATYHGTNAERDLLRAIPDPLKVVDYPCNFAASIRGISINKRSITLVSAGKLVRTIPVPLGVPVTFPELTQLIADPGWLAETAPGVFELQASVVQQAGTVLNVDAPAVRMVRIDMDKGITIGGSDAIGNFSGVTVESWIPATKTPVESPKLGRPFLLYENASIFNISHCTMQYLGSDATSSYGVSWRVGGTSGVVDDSLFQHNFFGVYTFGAANVTFEDSTYRYNAFYGLDPHTGSTKLTVIDNDVYGNADHGIIFSRHVTDSVVAGNYVHGNKINGIMMDFDSDGNTISDNVVTGNQQGIVLAGSSRNTVVGNTLRDNGVGIRASHAGSSFDVLAENKITGGQVGIQLYGGATDTTVENNSVRGPSSEGMILDSPRSVVTGNTIGATPTGMKVQTATSVIGGSMNVGGIGIEVGPEGFASVRSVVVHGPRPLSRSAGSVVLLTATAFGLPHAGTSPSPFDIAGLILIIFALLCEVVHLARGRGVSRLAVALERSTGAGAVVERPVGHLLRLSVRSSRPPTLLPPVVEDDLPAEGEDRVRRFRPDIEGLRAVAVVFVVLDHASLGLPGGFIGVDVFFVISGFLITQQLLRQRGRSGRPSLRQFYARRVRRILPAATLVICATLLGSAFVVSPLRLPGIAKDGAAAALFGVNWRLAAAGTNYFNFNGPLSPFQHYWSLSVEEQFYVAWPLLILGLGVAFRSKRSWRVSLTLVLGAIIASSLWASIYVTRVSSSYAYFGTHTRAWELAVGALVAVWAPTLARLPRPGAWAMAWIGLGAIFFAGFTLSGGSAYPGWLAQIPVYGSALIIAAGCGMAVRGGPELVLSRPVMQYMGRISFSLYLWHWPLLVLLPDFLGHAPSWPQRLDAVGVAVLLSIVTFALVEQPIRRSTWLVARPKRGLLVGAGLICTCLVVSYVIGAGVGRPTSPDAPVTTPELAAAMSQASGTAVTGLSGALAQAAAALRIPTNVTPSVAQAGSDFGMDSHGCEVGPTATTPLLPCDEFGDPTGQTDVVLVGDSHAGMWLPAVNELAVQKGWRLTFMAKTGCPVGDYPTFELSGYANRPYTECNAWRSAIIRHIAALKPALVIVASEQRSIAAAEPNGLTRSLDAIKKSAKRVIFLADTPKPSTDVPDCLAAHGDDLPACDLSVAAAGVQSSGRLAEIAGAEAAGAFVVDPTPWFCTATLCPAVIQDAIVYVDASHITETYALLREPQLAAAIEADLGEK